ncbi:MAG: glycosyltransferase family 39 protein [Bacteroidia bacterium]|nr:glycosyltransferase family 39 protein [Bacteroidia bacterium]
MFRKIFQAIKKTDNRILFFGLVILLFFLNFYSKTFTYRPSGMHQWRQADCLSITKNYYEEGLNFFEPKIHYQGVKDGHAVSECPLLNYTVACLWKIFGEHEFIYRLLEYLIFIAAMFVLFNTVFRYFKSTLLALFVVSVFLTSPLLVFYSANFIADVPALSLSIICFCYFYRFYDSKTIRFFYLSLLFGTLAILVKASALMGISLVFFFTLADLTGLNRFLKTEKLFEKKLSPSLMVFVSVATVFAWYKYALYYNNNNNNNIFLLTVLPIWEMQETEVINNTKVLFNNLFPVFLNRPMFFLFFALVIYVIAQFRKLNAFLKYSFVFSATFFLIYLLFFFQVFTVHDYYLSNLMFFPMITMVCFAYLMHQKEFVPGNIRFVRWIVIVLLIFNSFHAAAIYRLRMIEDDKLVAWYPFISEDEAKLAKYLFWDYNNSVKNFETLTPDLRQLGIKREDKVLAVFDQSFNIALYFLDQKGYSVARHHLQEDSLVLDRFMNNKIKYVIFCDTFYKNEKAFKRHAMRFETIYTKGKVQVLKFR